MSELINKLKKLKRYDAWAYIEDSVACIDISPDSNGDFIKVSDLTDLIKIEQEQVKK